MLAPVPVVITVPGNVSESGPEEGNPESVTLPTGEVQVGDVIKATTGAEGIEG